MNFKPYVLRLGLLAVCLSLFACAGTNPSSRFVIVTGQGVNLEEARKDAIRQAIQSQIGAFALSDLTINNETVIEDRVSEYSGALLDKMQVIESIPSPNGGWRYKAKIAVLEDAQRQSNRTPLIKTGALDGQSLTGFAISYSEKRWQAAATWEKVLNRMPLRAFYYEVSNVGLLNPPTVQNDSVTLSFITAPHWRMNYVNELRQALKYAALPAAATFAIPNGIHWQQNMPDPDQTGICLADGFRSSGLGSSVECFILDVSSEQVKQWLCFAKGLDLSFETKGIGSKSFAYNNLTHGLQFPFLETDRNNGPSTTFIFEILSAADLKEEPWYPDYPGAAAWSTKVPLSDLPNLKGIRAVAGCNS